MLRFFLRAPSVAASLSVISVTALRAGQLLRGAERAFAQIDYLEQNMATAEKLGQLQTSVNDLLDSVATLSSVIETETQQQTQQMQQNATTLEALQAQLHSGADDGAIQATISQLQQGNTAVKDSISRIQNIVPDAQSAVTAATTASSEVSSAVESSAATDGTSPDGNTTSDSASSESASVETPAV